MPSNTPPASDDTLVVRHVLDLATLEAPPEVLKNCMSLAAQMSGTIEGVEGTPGDWRAPPLKIVQPVTQDPSKPEDAKNGDFFAKTGAVVRPLRGVVAYVWYSRAFYSEEETCGSDNVDTQSRNKADDKSMSRYGDACKKCPLDVHPREALPKDAKTGKPVRKPLCQNVTNVIFVTDDASGVYNIQFKGASSQAGRQLVDMVRAHGVPWARVFSIDTEQKKREQGGLYYVYKVTPTSLPVADWLKTMAISVKEYFADYRQKSKSDVQIRSNDVRSTVEINSLTNDEVIAVAKKKGVQAEF